MGARILLGFGAAVVGFAIVYGTFLGPALDALRQIAVSL